MQVAHEQDSGMNLVLDSSATLAWVYADEITPAIRDVFRQIIESGAWVPALWRLEVANVLEMSVKRGRHPARFRDATLSDLALLPIHLDADTEKQAWGATLRLAERHRLTMYDAAYLELAMRRGLPIATLDVELRKAAKAEKVIAMGK